ncbi:MAG: glutamate synthase (NADPH), homotetrameric [Candidatus Schekmanbacteria bacterium RBG_13_48_7]|uniref:Glutamate synthase (NADPH), homotetrameric n=1 Tax=Candidatus Schekmanbacteria bacterium RBG_13_48_7 TaxID=1817878 RepID=A0A1F7RS11_9BACT|nr:MAG: glutamate synthase (NADPH), homotetrameric [Candidatus Schekmanbacteria bacterium RBG_13_48_7]
MADKKEDIKKSKPKKPKIPRQSMPEQDPQVRRHNFNEVPLGYPPEIAILEAKRCIQCKKPLCIEGCPVEIKIPEFIHLIAEGKFLEAAWKLKEDNALPAICGRVCPQETQCEIKCVLGKKSTPVAIGRLERFAADIERSKGALQLPKIPSSTGKKIAIVGSGPAGLTVAGDLIKLGHDVTIFEALHKPGGVLVYGIPEFRLPKSIVKAEVDYLQQLGVKIECNVLVGKTYTIDDLLKEEGYHAIFIGTGAGAPRFMGIPGENLKGVYSANEYLTRVNLMKAYEFPKYDTPFPRGKNIAALGAGNVTMDCARTALRLGAENVHVVYRRSRAEMPARLEEIHHAEEEGVQFHLLQTPVRILGNSDGWVVAMEIIKMELGEPDSSGRRRPIPIQGSEFTMNVDAVICAIGTDANPLIRKTTPDIEHDKWGHIIIDKTTGVTSKKGVYAGGDIVTGSATVIEAMGAGKTAAKSIHQYLQTL